MRSWRIATLAGIGVYVHWSFLILPILVAYSSLSSGSGWVAAGRSIVFVLGVFGCVLLHEFGHALTARRFGIHTRSITLLPIGGVASLDRMPERPLQELAVALAGPLVNVVIAGCLFAVLVARGVATQQMSTQMLSTSLLFQLFAANIMLVVFNLLPAFPMDGGRVLRAVLAIKLSYVRATNIAALFGRIMAALFVIFGFVARDFMLVFIAVFIYVAGRAEAQMARAKASLEGWSVGDAMQRRFQILPADAPLESAIAALQLSPQHAFPVVDGVQFVGLLEKNVAMAAAAEGSASTVGELTKRDLPILTPDTALAECLAQMQQAQRSALPVLRGQQLVGIITAENLRQWLAAMPR